MRGRCAGAVLYNMETEEFYTVKAKAVILASGGIGRLHIQQFPTTNHYGATADGLVIAYRAGAELIHMDSIQYHPTGVVWPEQLLGQLITEVMRGHGAQLVNVDGNRFINELECRDTCASACIRECVDRKKGVVTPRAWKGSGWTPPDPGD
jgi:succinate dehydrogenase/fumarate reductase flavoprotein subunit